MPIPQLPEIRDGLCTYRPKGTFTLVGMADLVAAAIAQCRDAGLNKLLIDALEVAGVPIPTLVDRFLMVEEWAHEAGGEVFVALVVPPEYIHPRKFGVKVAAHFGLTGEVFPSEDDAKAWLSQVASRDATKGRA